MRSAEVDPILPTSLKSQGSIKVRVQRGVSGSGHAGILRRAARSPRLRERLEMHRETWRAARGT